MATSISTVGLTFRKGIQTYEAITRLVGWTDKDLHHSYGFAGKKQLGRDNFNTGLCFPSQEYQEQAPSKSNDLEENPFTRVYNGD